MPAAHFLCNRLADEKLGEAAMSRISASHLETGIAENRRRAIQAGHEAEMKHPVAVMMFLENGLISGRLQAEFQLPDAPFPKLQIGKAGAVRVESVRYSPADGLYACRCVLCWPEGENPKDAAEIIARVNADTGLTWEVV